jgi:3-ketosteroid 9alpha-monooxygenase subunit A
MSRRFPFTTYPSSWYRIMDSADLKPGQTRTVHWFGRQLEVRRTGSSVSVTGYPVTETNGIIAVFHDDLGREPFFDIPAVSDRPGWTPYTRRNWRIRTHVQEIVENGADGAHQLSVHGAIELPVAAAEPDGHYFRGGFTAKYADRSDPTIYGIKATFIDIGMGFTHLEMEIDYAGMAIRRFIHMSYTPVDEAHVEVSFAIRTFDLGDPELTELVHNQINEAVWVDFERDIPIWENKCYRSLPAHLTAAETQEPARLCAGEGDIAKIRTWARQFYPTREFV